MHRTPTTPDPDAPTPPELPPTEVPPPTPPPEVPVPDEPEPVQPPAHDPVPPAPKSGYAGLAWKAGAIQRTAAIVTGRRFELRHSGTTSAA